MIISLYNVVSSHGDNLVYIITWMFIGFDIRLMKCITSLARQSDSWTCRSDSRSQPGGTTVDTSMWVIVATVTQRLS